MWRRATRTSAGTELLPVPEIGAQADPVFQYQIPEACAPGIYISKLWQAGLGPAKGLRPLISRNDAETDWPLDILSRRGKDEQEGETEGDSITRPARQNLFAP